MKLYAAKDACNAQVPTKFFQDALYALLMIIYYWNIKAEKHSMRGFLFDEHIL